MLLEENEKKLRTDLYGKKTETIATEYLKSNGYKILERNYLCPLGEIDIIANIDDRIVFVEVKARTNGKFGYGREAITSEKIRKIRNASAYYLKRNCKSEVKVRFDLIELQNDKVVAHLTNIF